MTKETLIIALGSYSLFTFILGVLVGDYHANGGDE